MEKIFIHEVGLRDGLQMEKETVPTEIKIKWAKAAMDAGADIIQLGSFVHPVKVPQMADTANLFEFFRKEGKSNPDVILSGLVLNEKGLERGMDCGVEMFCMGVSASETHSKKNTGMEVAEATKRIVKMALNAMDDGKFVQVSVQSAFGCGFEGEIAQEKVINIVRTYLDEGIRLISLADTVGHGKPEHVKRMFSTIKEIDPDVQLACHFHDTHGQGMANSLAALESGVTYYESAFAGLGGCPFTKSPVGNIATETLLQGLREKKIREDIKLDNFNDLALEVRNYFNR